MNPLRWLGWPCEFGRDCHLVSRHDCPHLRWPGRVTVRPVFEPRDLWIGIYWDPYRERVWVMLVPTLGFVVERLP